MKKKYQIFISSTYNDLKDERTQVIKAILEMGHIPVGMEMFSAGDDEQWKIIANQILDSDYYLIIVAHRYGSLTKEGISYTEKEYDFAVTNSIPVMGFIIDEDAFWSSKNIDKGDTYILLNNFKSKIKNRLVNFWNNKDELHALVSIALVKTFENKPRSGWIKAEEENIKKNLQELISAPSSNYSKLMDSVRSVVNRLTPGNNIHDLKYEFNSVELEYFIHASGDITVEQVITLTANADLFFFSIWIEGDSFCEKASSIYDLDFNVEIISDSGREVAFTQILELEFKKEIAIWFLNYLPKDEIESIKITYKWKGYFERLLSEKRDELELLFRSKNQGNLNHLKVAMHPIDLEKRISIKNIGAKMPDEQIIYSDNNNSSIYLSNHSKIANSKIHLLLEVKDS